MLLRDGTFTVLRNHTVQVLAYATAVQSVPAHRLQEFGRVREWQGTSAQNLTVVKVDAENNLIAVKGAIPGPNKGIVVIKDSVKA